MSTSNPVCLPIDKTVMSQEFSEELDKEAPYRKAVGSKIYLVMVTRPDIMYSVNVLSQVLDNPTKIHWCIAKKALRYLNGKPRWGPLQGWFSSTVEEQ